MKYKKLCPDCQNDTKDFLEDNSVEVDLSNIMTDIQISRKLCLICYTQYKSLMVNVRKKA